MGNISFCATNCFRNVFFLLQEKYKIFPEYVFEGIVGPDKKIISIEGLELNIRVLNIFPRGLLHIIFFCNLSGQDVYMKRGLRLTNLPEYKGIEEDLKELFSGLYLARLTIEKDQGYIYSGKIKLNKNGQIFDVSEYLSQKIPEPSILVPEDKSDEKVEEHVIELDEETEIIYKKLDKIKLIENHLSIDIGNFGSSINM